MNMYNYIKDNLKRVNESIEKAIIKASRKDKVQLIAVSKKMEVEKIEVAIEAGHRTFGENYVQEAVSKIESLKRHENLEWHFIGALQSNKAKFCIDSFRLVQTVDRESVANALSKEALKRNVKDFPVLLEINLGNEKTKSGMSVEIIKEFIEKLATLEGIKIKGLMAIPPYFDEPEDSRPYFAKLKELFEQIKSKKIPNVEMVELSMGMSNDYHIAVEEGATIVRVGTAIFGQRV